MKNSPQPIMPKQQNRLGFKMKASNVTMRSDDSKNDYITLTTESQLSSTVASC